MPKLSNQVLLELGEVDLNIFWFLKDFGWVLCIPYVYIPAAAMAIFVGAALLAGQMRWGANHAQAVHTLAELLWVVGNSAWMLSEALYDYKAPSLPWHISPLVGSDKPMYMKGTLACSFILGIGALVLVGFYGSLVMQRCCGNQESNQEMVWWFIPADVYCRCFILPWMIKDICWSQSMLIPGSTCGALALMCLGDALRRSWSGLDRSAVLLICEMAWVAGNVAWMWNEIAMKDTVNTVRYGVAALFALITCTTIPYTLLAAKVTGEIGDEVLETTPVLSSGSKLSNLSNGKDASVFVPDTSLSSSSA